METIWNPNRIVQSRPNQSNLVHVLSAVTKPLRAMKLIVNRTPTKNVNKFNVDHKEKQLYSIVGHKGKQPYSTAVRVSDTNSILNVPDADLILNVSNANQNHSNVRLIQPTSQSNVHVAL